MDTQRSDTTPDSCACETVADQRERAADLRESALDEREYRVMAREDAESERADQVRTIMTEAEERDDRADVRDGVAIKRHIAASLAAWLHGTENDEADEERRLAWDARAHSRRDRAASADDREHLASNGTRPAADSDAS